ncbi:MAG: Gfo/Idh/MocA family oxidoreductase [Balneolaceae bacterium]
MADKKKDGLSRKSFIHKMGAASAAMVGVPFLAGSKKSQQEFIDLKSFTNYRSANDNINIALIGAGSMGQGDLATALEHSGTKVVAACDLYTSRLERCKQNWGDDVFTTKDYREILERDDVDAIINATTDHWHKDITIAALEKDIPVYLEKPMVQKIEEAFPVIEAENNSSAPLIVGSQRTSSILYEKARDLLNAGEIGKLNFVEAYWDRFSAIGAWQYSIPPGVNGSDVDWKTYRKGMDDMDFDPKHFFRWRNYDQYGTGVAGDLFVHLFSGLHLITGSTGPDSVMATGGLRYWDDGRDAEDVMLGLYNYPETEQHPNFSLSLRVNFADGSGGGSRIRMVGSEGEIEIGWDRVTLRKSSLPTKPGMSIGDFSDATREDYEEYYNERYPETRAQIIEPSEFVYRAPQGYNDRYDHFGFFFESIRDGKKVLQDGTFGLRAAGPALLANQAHDEKRVINWDPNKMEII